MYSPSRPTWVSIRERSSSCVWGGCQEGVASTRDTRAPCRLSLHLRHSTSTPADLHIAHGGVRGFLWPVWELLVACGLGIEQVGQRAQLEVVPVWGQGERSACELFPRGWCLILVVGGEVGEPRWVDERVDVPLNRSSTLAFRPTCWREGALARPEQAEGRRQVGAEEGPWPTGAAGPGWWECGVPSLPGQWGLCAQHRQVPQGGPAGMSTATRNERLGQGLEG